MDNTSVSEEQKNNLYNELYDALLTGLQTSTLSHEDSQFSAEFILESLDKIDSEDSMLFFLQDLANRWPVYKDTYLKYKDNDTQKQEASTLDATREKLNSI